MAREPVRPGRAWITVEPLRRHDDFTYECYVFFEYQQRRQKMLFKRFGGAELAVVAAFTLCSGSIVRAASVRSVTVFAEGAAVNASAPDSIAVTDDSIWVSYANGADSTGLSGSSTVVEYGFSGRIRHTFSIKGSVDGLKVDPSTGLVWAMQNQDGNSTLSGTSTLELMSTSSDRTVVAAP
jgi:hypothetical protein